MKMVKLDSTQEQLTLMFITLNLFLGLSLWLTKDSGIKLDLKGKSEQWRDRSNNAHSWCKLIRITNLSLF